MSYPFEPKDPLKERRTKLPETGRSGPKMDPYLAELLQSANTDHVLQRGTGMHSQLIRSLAAHALDPKNAPHLGKILDAIERLELAIRMDPIRVGTRVGLREVLGNGLGDWVLGARGPMELE